MSVTEFERLPLDSQRRIDGVCARFERAWSAGDAVDLSTFLAHAPAGERVAWLTELLHIELECRRRLGDAPAADDYLSRFPDDAAVIADVFTVVPIIGEGSTIGRYVLRRVIGRGSSGVVHEADDPVIDRPVAVKLLTGRADAARVVEEARLTGRLQHPNIVTLYDAGSSHGIWYMAMERLAGSAADRIQQEGAFDPVTATRIAADACRGLLAAHAAGLVHRDVKPANLLLPAVSGSSTGNVVAKLSDFGLALGPDGAGDTAGTPLYMAPEQFTGQPADACSDIYSLGATYYTLLTGKPPFEAATAADAMAAHRNAPVPTLPGPAGRVIARALAKAPADRYPDAAALLADLEAILAPQPRRWLGFAALLLTAAVMAMMVWLVASPAGDEPETGWVSLFNGRDLSGWEVFVENGQLGHDPDSVFSVIEIDGGPAIRATGQKNGTLTSVAEHENFHLRLEYRWKGLEGKHNSGVMYHANGEHGSGFSGALPSHEYEIVPRNVGGYFRSGDHRLVDLAEVHRGRFVPIEPVLQRARARQDRELKTGRWNQIEIVCWRDSAVHVLNDFVTLVLARSRTPDGQPLTKGRLQLQSYQGEVYFRNIGIRPITAIPARFR